MIYLIFATFITYFYIICFSRKLSSFIILLGNFIFLSYLHINRIYDEDTSRIGIETIYMMTICKFSSLSFGYEDGAKNDDEIPNSYWKSK